MPDQLTQIHHENGGDVLIVGAGNMAIEYSRVLTGLGRSHRVLGRGAASAGAFEQATGIAPSVGPLSRQLTEPYPSGMSAIVAVNAMHLGAVTEELATCGVGRILVEKPGALDTAEMLALEQLSASTGVDIRIGYNRRFFESVRRVREAIFEDGGVLSLKFDFSEPSRRIATLGKPQRELDTWFYGNSMHVVDLALHLAGDLSAARGDCAGGVSWHQAAGVFVGSGRTLDGALVSWHANWTGPGRWGLEVTTAERRLILQPLEQLRVQGHAGFDEVSVPLDDRLDSAYKPGLMRQVRAFLNGEDDEVLPDAHEQWRKWSTYELIRTGGSLETRTHRDA